MDKEDQKAQDARVRRLWQVLDTRQEGQLNLNGLKSGLNRLDHPLKCADSLLQDILKAVDVNGDGHIEYEEFRQFVQHTEKELWQLFQKIDRDHNGQLDKTELRSAFVAAGIYLPPSKLDQFFAEVDSNHDGVITWDEWRNFLLFIPADIPSLRAVLSYYSSTVTVNPEGDVPNESKEASFPWDPGEYIIENKASSEAIVIASTPEKAALLTDFAPHPGYFLAGGIAGVVSRTATAPLDRLKVYLIAQTGVKEEAVQAAKAGAPVKAARNAAGSLLEATRTLWRLGGVQSLFAGSQVPFCNGLNVLKVMPESAIKFGSYEGSKRAFARLEGHDDPKNLAPWSQFFAAGMAGMISQFAIYPLDTLKFRMQNETVKGGPTGNALISKTAKKMWAQGPRSFYRGITMGLVGMFPYSAIDLTTFEYLKQFVTARNARRLGVSQEDESAQPGNFTTAAMGASSGAFGASAVYPLNLLRTRLQSQGTAIHPPTYTGIWDVTVKTVQGEGMRGLFKGITPNLLKVVPAVSITYVVYDNSKSLLGLR
ncbi:uncharacterized protein KY384_007682 [Bacidia gigantensis]|uniref:uncharacterized protein n=1 Tax=Bacidia gigantensis TaxID=2732470 RepID=UPI001D037FFA|nr:uncharacterized protein KY384_007682 [Bacidia gigantensis]KAG8527530.1 hypothetical protein KY384_007682 [Bacidia gigantensis]